MNNLFSVEDKVVLITGGSGGIGSVLLEGFRTASAYVASFDRVSPKVDSKFIKFYKVDISNYSELKDVFSKFLEDFGRIDVLVNCAGTTAPVDNIEYPLNLWKETLDNNLNAVFYLSQLAGLQMIKQGEGGSIINITSINASCAMPNNPAYAAAKSGTRHLTKALALDWGRYGIRVNNVGPGYTETQINKKSLNDPVAYKKRADLSMLGRWAKPKEMVGPVIFLASNASSFVTGTDLWVDGGWLAKGM